MKPASQLHWPVTGSQLPSPFLQSHVSAQSVPQWPASHAAKDTPHLTPRERERMRHLQLKPAEVMVSLVHRYLSCSCVQSSRERRNTGRSPRHSERCSRRYTSPDTPVQSVRSDTLRDDRRKGTGFWKPVFWETSSNNCVMILIPKAALANLHSSPQIRLPQLGHCLTRYHGNQAHYTDTYCSDTISP